MIELVILTKNTQLLLTLKNSEPFDYIIGGEI